MNQSKYSSFIVLSLIVFNVNAMEMSVVKENKKQKIWEKLKKKLHISSRDDIQRPQTTNENQSHSYSSFEEKSHSYSLYESAKNNGMFKVSSAPQLTTYTRSNSEKFIRDPYEKLSTAQKFLLQAIENNSLTQVQTLLTTIDSLNFKDGNGHTPIKQAVLNIISNSDDKMKYNDKYLQAHEIFNLIHAKYLDNKVSQEHLLQFIEENNLKAVTIMLPKLGTLNFVNAQDDTPLVKAVLNFVAHSMENRYLPSFNNAKEILNEICFKVTNGCCSWRDSLPIESLNKIKHLLDAHPELNQIFERAIKEYNRKNDELEESPRYQRSNSAYFQRKISDADFQ